MLAHKRSGKRKSQILDLVHNDVCGPMPTMSLGGVSYFSKFIDDYIRYILSSIKMQCFRIFKSLSHLWRFSVERSLNSYTQIMEESTSLGHLRTLVIQKLLKES